MKSKLGRFLQQCLKGLSKLVDKSKYLQKCRSHKLNPKSNNDGRIFQPLKSPQSFPGARPLASLFASTHVKPLHPAFDLARIPLRSPYTPRLRPLSRTTRSHAFVSAVDACQAGATTLHPRSLPTIVAREAVDARQSAPSILSSPQICPFLQHHLLCAAVKGPKGAAEPFFCGVPGLFSGDPALVGFVLGRGDEPPPTTVG